MLMAAALHDWLWAFVGCRAQEEAEFRELAARPNVLDLIPKRIAPQIFGSDRIKEAVACLLFGGSRKVREQLMYFVSALKMPEAFSSLV